MLDVIERFMLSPYLYGSILAVILVTQLIKRLSELSPKNQNKTQYLAVGINQLQMDVMSAMVAETDATDNQKRWVLLNVVSEVENQINIGVLARRKALRLMLVIRTIPLFTGLLTALAAQVEIIRAPSLFMVNVMMMFTSIAIEISRTKRHYNVWAYSREAANRLYSALSRYLALFSQADNFVKFAKEIDFISSAYDRTINTMIAMDLEMGSVDADADSSNAPTKNGLDKNDGGRTYKVGDQGANTTKSQSPPETIDATVELVNAQDKA